MKQCNSCSWRLSRSRPLQSLKPFAVRPTVASSTHVHATATAQAPAVQPPHPAPPPPVTQTHTALPTQHRAIQPCQRWANNHSSPTHPLHPLAQPVVVSEQEDVVTPALHVPPGPQPLQLLHQLRHTTSHSVTIHLRYHNLTGVTCSSVTCDGMAGHPGRTTLKWFCNSCTPDSKPWQSVPGPGLKRKRCGCDL